MTAKKPLSKLPQTSITCTHCGASSGPCGRQVHCAAAPIRQAAWDLAARDLQAAPFSFDSQTAFIIANKLFYQGSGNITSWHNCNCAAGTSDGCGATNAYMQWLMADDDNGNLADGTPHMTAIFNAFNRHGIACTTPTAVNSGCAGGPTTAIFQPAFAPDGRHAVVRPATPADIVKRLETELVAVLAQPAVRQRLAELGALPAQGDARELDAFVRSETAKWAGVIKAANIKLD